MEVDELHAYLQVLKDRLIKSIDDGKYHPIPVRRAENLKKLVSDEQRVKIAVFCRKKYWRMSVYQTVNEALSDERLLRVGYPTFKMYYHPVFRG